MEEVIISALSPMCAGISGKIGIVESPTRLTVQSNRFVDDIQEDVRLRHLA